MSRKNTSLSVTVLTTYHFVITEAHCDHCRFILGEETSEHSTDSGHAGAMENNQNLTGLYGCYACGEDICDNCVAEAPFCPDVEEPPTRICKKCAEKGIRWAYEMDGEPTHVIDKDNNEVPMAKSGPWVKQ